MKLKFETDEDMAAWLGFEIKEPTEENREYSRGYLVVRGKTVPALNVRMMRERFDKYEVRTATEMTKQECAGQGVDWSPLMVLMGRVTWSRCKCCGKAGAL